MRDSKKGGEREKEGVRKRQREGERDGGGERERKGGGERLCCPFLPQPLVCVYGCVQVREREREREKIAAQYTCGTEKACVGERAWERQR